MKHNLIFDFFWGGREILFLYLASLLSFNLVS